MAVFTTHLAGYEITLTSDHTGAVRACVGSGRNHSDRSEEMTTTEEVADLARELMLFARQMGYR